MSGTPSHCPKCAADLQGDPIAPEIQHLFGATHGSRVIGISDGDSVGYWRCPDCRHEWERDGFLARAARKNLARRVSQ